MDSWVTEAEIRLTRGALCCGLCAKRKLLVEAADGACGLRGRADRGSGDVLRMRTCGFCEKIILFIKERKKGGGRFLQVDILERSTRAFILSFISSI